MIMGNIQQYYYQEYMLFIYSFYYIKLNDNEQDPIILLYST